MLEDFCFFKQLWAFFHQFTASHSYHSLENFFIPSRLASGSDNSGRGRWPCTKCSQYGSKATLLVLCWVRNVCQHHHRWLQARCVPCDHPHPVSRLLLTQWTPWTLHSGKIQVLIYLKVCRKIFLIATKSTVVFRWDEEFSIETCMTHLTVLNFQHKWPK